MSHDASPTYSRIHAVVFQQIFIERIPCFKTCPWNRTHIKSVGSLCVQPPSLQVAAHKPHDCSPSDEGLSLSQEETALSRTGPLPEHDNDTRPQKREGWAGAGGTHHFRGCGISLLGCRVSTESFSLFGLKLGKDKSLLRPLPNPPHWAPRAREKEGAPASGTGGEPGLLSVAPREASCSHWNQEGLRRCQDSSCCDLELPCPWISGSDRMSPSFGTCI